MSSRPISARSSGPDPQAASPLAPHHLDQGAAAVAKVLSYLRPELRHPERIPSGGVLLVGNHALMGIDSFALYPLLWKHLRRLPRGLGDRFLFKVPAIGKIFERIGAIEGDPRKAEALLRQGELCLVYPGGSAESFKSPEQRYQLFWENRLGFARLAMSAQVPVVPVMAAGVDHAYRFLFRDKLLTRRIAGQGKARYDFPVSLGLGVLPLPVQFTYHVGEPLHPPQGAELARDPHAVAAFQLLVWQAAQRQLDAAVTEWQAQPRDWLDELARKLAG